jgi:hypothetical protein
VSCERDNSGGIMKEYKDMIIELSGDEGVKFTDLEPTAYTFTKGTHDIMIILPKKQIRFCVKVIGFRDDKAPKRNWGKSIEE